MPANIVIDCERMKNPHTGLYHFCYNLGKNVIKNTNPSTETIHFFLPANKDDIFGKEANYIHQKPWHKLILPQLRNLKVWHATHQDTAYFPVQEKYPVVLTIHDLNIMHSNKKSDRNKKKFLSDLKKKIERADHITFISSFTKDDVKQYIDITNKPSTVIHNGCNISEIEHLMFPSNSPKSPFYFSIGTIAEKKNFHVLPLLLVGNDRLLIIAGITQSENYKQKIIEEAIKNNVRNRVIFTGPINENDKQWYFKNCEAFIFPSLAEGFGLPVVEAMYFGKPIFLSNHTSLPEIGGDDAYYFNSFEKKDMQNVLQQGLQHYQLNAASKSIKARAASFSWDEAAKKYLQIYRSLY